MTEKIAIVGLGYVGLPVALAFARKFPGTLGFDINRKKIDTLKNNIDDMGEITRVELERTPLRFSDDPSDLAGCNFFIVTVPTPIDEQNRPDLRPVISASQTIGKHLQSGALIVYESTVYPGVTEDVCGPILEEYSGLKCGSDFKLAYSPERINPGDREHVFEKIVKVVSAQDAESLERTALAYETVVTAGVHRAPAIRAAEAAKLIENTQRDLNVALMNELALIFDRLGIVTNDVLQAAQTKWNFLPFTPGLVGGHCIGVDPYYLTGIAERVGYHPEVILAGRRINDRMGQFLAQKMIKLFVQRKIAIKGARVGILGLTFKENVRDIRNSRVPDIVAELQEFGVETLVHDPFVEQQDAVQEYDIELQKWSDLQNLDGLIFAVGHRVFLDKPLSVLLALMKPAAVFMDVKSLFRASDFPDGIMHWSL